jgi:aminocarboxymuconate-semialdehyde decarboxylase
MTEPTRLCIDVHAHLAVEEADALMRPHAAPSKEPALTFADDETRADSIANMRAIRCKLTSLDERLVEMDRMGIDMQLVSPSPHHYCYWAEPELGVANCQLINNALAEQVRRRPDRFAALGCVPLQAAELAVRELERCMDVLGFSGVEIGSNVAGVELDDPRLAAFFAAAEARGAFLFLHPLGFSHGERLRPYHLNNVIGNPLESAIAVSRLIMGGVLERHPALRLCVAHGGGYLPAYAGRLDHAWSVREHLRASLPKRPSEYLARLYFDTVVHSSEQLEHLVRRYGASQLLLGTDYPFDMGEPEPLALLKNAQSLSEQQRADIAGGNAARLLGLERADATTLARRPYQKGLQELGRGLYAYLQPDGGWSLSNAGLIADGEQSLLIDTLFDLPLTAAMLESMRRAEPKAAKHIDTLVNTHANPDHTNGNILVKDAEIISSVGTARGMQRMRPEQLAAMLRKAREDAGSSKTARFMLEIFGRFQLDGIEACFPTREFEKQLSLRVGDTAVELLDLGPAHTDSDVVVHVPAAKLLFTGDILFIGSHPIMWVGPVENWLRACERILELDVDLIVPGHGPVTDKRGVRAVHEYFSRVSVRAKDAFASGITSTEAAREIARDLEGSRYATWKDAERLVATVGCIYRELSQTKTPPVPGSAFADMAELAEELAKR